MSHDYPLHSSLKTFPPYNFSQSLQCNLQGMSMQRALAWCSLPQSLYISSAVTVLGDSFIAAVSSGILPAAAAECARAIGLEDVFQNIPDSRFSSELSNPPHHAFSVLLYYFLLCSMYLVARCIDDIAVSIPTCSFILVRNHPLFQTARLV